MVKNDDQQLPIHLAAKKSNVEVFNVIHAAYQDGLNVRDSCMYPVHAVRDNPDPDVLKTFITIDPESLFQLSSDNLGALDYCILQEDSSKYEMVLQEYRKHRRTINLSQSNPLRTCLSHCLKYDMLNSLIQSFPKHLIVHWIGNAPLLHMAIETLLRRCCENPAMRPNKLLLSPEINCLDLLLQLYDFISNYSHQEQLYNAVESVLNYSESMTIVARCLLNWKPYIVSDDLTINRVMMLKYYRNLNWAARRNALRIVMQVMKGEGAIEEQKNSHSERALVRTLSALCSHNQDIVKDVIMFL